MTARGLLAALLVAVLAAAAGYAWVRAEGTRPGVSAPKSLAVGAAGAEVPLDLTDPDSGLRSASAVLAHAGGQAQLLSEAFPGSWRSGGPPQERVVVRIDPETLGLRDGDAFLRIEVRDRSWRGGFAGNATRLEVPVTIDLSKPRIAVESGLTYVRRGGSGAVVYSISEPSVRDGVRVGEDFYRGFALDGGARRVAIFAVAANSPQNPRIGVTARDAAGNEAEARWPVVVQERVLPRAQVTLPRSFLDQKVRDLADGLGIETDDPTEAFREINTRLREANEARIRETVADSAPRPLWDGAFEQLDNSKVTSRFAEQRVYFVGGQSVSEATHYGFDLASTAAAPVTAANAGRVLFAGELGIYGNCVLLDHGLGVSSLYGHLSRLDVAAGDPVKKGTRLGLSGATGLAGGDHLHFAMLVGGTYVDPLEWWDPKWVRTHIEARTRNTQTAPPSP